MAIGQEVRDLQEKMALACRIMGHRGVTRGSYGHISARVPGEENRFLIKAKGPEEVALEFATARDIIIIDEEAETVEAPEGLQAPNEAAMHLAVFRKRPEVNSVTHMHPDWVVALTAAEKPLLPIYGNYEPSGLALVIKGIPTYPRSHGITTDELGDQLATFMGDKDVCMLRGHGITTAGRSVEQATSNAFSLYELARLNYMAYAIGDPKPIPQEDIDEATPGSEASKNRGRRRHEYDRATPMWRYYRQTLGEQ